MMDDETFSDVSRDVSSSAKADGGGSKAKEGAKVHYQLLTEGAEVHYQLLRASSPSSGYRQGDVSPPTNVSGSSYGTKEQDVPPATMDTGISSDVSSSAKADGGRSGAKEGAKVDGSPNVHYQLLTAASPSSGNRQADVSPPTISA